MNYGCCDSPLLSGYWDRGCAEVTFQFKVTFQFALFQRSKEALLIVEFFMRLGTHFHIFLHRSIEGIDACWPATPAYCKNCDASLFSSLPRPLGGGSDLEGGGDKISTSPGIHLSLSLKPATKLYP
jgi:hypothetical protein